MELIGRQIQLEHYPHDQVGPRHFQLVEVRVRQPAEGEVLVRNTWTSVASMSSARAFLATAVGADGRIYAIGDFQVNDDKP